MNTHSNQVRGRLRVGKVLSALTFAATVVSSIGCLSDAELDARQEWAFDLEGTYTAETDETLQVVNEDDKNNVIVEITRGDISEDESAFLDRLTNEDDRSALLEKVVLGDEARLGEAIVAEIRGGENVSKDFGETSEIEVYTGKFAATPINSDASNAQVEYRATLTIANGSADLTGILRVIQTETRGSGDEEETLTEDLEIALSFTRDAGPIDAPKCENDCLPEEETATDPTNGNDVQDDSDETENGDS